MTLATGARLGSYEILSLIGRGGMGEVYLARDSKLDRSVAIKILPESMAKDKERVARFEREAKLLASLNHPSIAAIYGFDECDGTRFLVMEYVEGGTLRSHLGEGPIAVEDALNIAKQIADALEAAHEQGVIHRDLKPANVILRTDGTVKVLDFGLAKAMSDDPSGSELANSPTITADYTRPGVVLGTAAYMSPEQARGRALDKRTDIWSFGIILFECLTGETLFRGETATDSMGAIMHKDPDWSLLPPNTPPTIQLLLRRCLTKDRKRRLHDIADARIELENALVDPTSTSLGLARAAPEVNPRWLPPWPVIGVCGVLIAVAAIGGWLAKPAEPKEVWKLTLGVPEDAGYEYTYWRGGGLAISPDGRQVAITLQSKASADSDRTSRLFLRRTDQTEGSILANTEGVDDSTFSPDGNWIAFTARGGVLKKIAVSGGPTSTIYRIDGDGGLYGPKWGEDGTIVFVEWRDSGVSLCRVSANGGPVTLLASQGRESDIHLDYPYFLPDGSGIIYTAGKWQDEWDDMSVLALRFGEKEPTVVMKGGSNAFLLPTGHFVYLRAGSLLVAPFDETSLKPSAPGVPVLEGLETRIPMAGARLDVSRNGTLVYHPGGTDPYEDLSLSWVSLDGTVTKMSEHMAPFRSLAVSPDGKYISARINESDGRNQRLYLLELERDLMRPVVAAQNIRGNHVWTPDGKWIIYFSHDTVEGTKDLYRVRTDFTGKPERLTTSEREQEPMDISHDGRLLAVQDWNGTVWQVFLLHLDEAGQIIGEPIALDDSETPQFSATFSPDGKWIAYQKIEGDELQVYVKSADGSGAAAQVSTESGYHPCWSPVENVLYFSGKWNFSTVYSVSYSVENGEFRPALPKQLFKFESDGTCLGRFRIAPDGKRFLCALAPGAKKTVWVNPRIILNWFEELKAKVPKEAKSR